MNTDEFVLARERAELMFGKLIPLGSDVLVRRTRFWLCHGNSPRFVNSGLRMASAAKMGRADHENGLRYR
jgi:hypothetical protein